MAEPRTSAPPMWVPLPVTIGVNLPDEADPLGAGELIAAALSECSVPLRAALAYRPMPAELVTLSRVLGRRLSVAQVALYPSLLQVLTEADPIEIDHITMLAGVAIEDHTIVEYGCTANAAVQYMHDTHVYADILRTIAATDHVWTTDPPPRPMDGYEGWKR